MTVQYQVVYLTGVSKQIGEIIRMPVKSNIIKELNAKWQTMYPGLARLQCSDWKPWLQRDNVSSINEIGVYILARFNSGEVPTLVNPLCENIVYFGKTNNGKSTSFRQRLRYFDLAAFGKGAPHSGGYNYRQDFGPDSDNLFVSLLPVYWHDWNSTISNLGAHEFIISQVTILLEICLRGLFVYQRGRLPQCNKE